MVLVYVVRGADRRLLQSMPMSFSLVLVTDMVQVEPGSSAPVAIDVINKGEAPDQFELVVEGTDSEWLALPVPTFTVGANESHTERFFFKPPRESTTQAGNYPFVVRVRSLETGESRTAQGVLEVKEFSHLTVDVQPKRVKISPTSREVDLQIMTLNLGNSDQTVQLFANDTEDMFAYEFEQEQVSLAPGTQKTVVMTATSSKNSLLANSRLQGFNVTARSVNNPAVAASTQGQIEQRALVTPGAFLVFLLIVILAGSWIALIPKPPQIDSFVTSKQSVLVGEEVTITWQTSHANAVELSIGDIASDRQPADGTYRFVAEKEGIVEVTLTAVRDSVRSSSEMETVKVELAPEAPLPVVRTFDIEPANLKVGQTFVVTYSFNESVTKATIFPANVDVDPKAGSIQLKADIAGTTEYKLIAYNADGKSVEKTKTIKVIEASLASIIKFDINPKEVVDPDGRVSIVWQFANATRAELDYAGGQIELDPDRGQRDVVITSDTKFTLTIYDEKGIKATKAITIKVKPLVEPPATTGTTGATGGTVPPPTGTTTGN